MQLNKTTTMGINDPLRLLIYGAAHTRKTWWIGKAAESNFNIVLLDGDNNWHILKKIAPEAQKRIQIVPMSDSLGKPVYAHGLTRLLKDGYIIWHEKEKRSAKLSPDEYCINVDLRSLDDRTVVVVDSWTAFVTSLMLQYAKENMIDLSDAEESDDKRGYYRWAGALASWAITQLCALPCHVVVIAHADVYEKRKKQGKKEIIEWTKRQIKSTSGPNAMQIPSKFPNMPYFYQKGTASKISTAGNDEADGGCALIAPGEYNWDDLQFKDFVLAAGLQLPSTDNPLIDYSIQAASKGSGRVLSTGAVQQSVVKPQPNLVKPESKPVAKITLGNLAK